MVQHMARDNVPQRPNGQTGSVRRTGSLHHLFRKTPEQVQCGASQVDELLAKAGQFPAAGVRFRGVVVFFKSRQGRWVFSREPQRAVRHDALGIEHMAQDFLDRPLSRLVPEETLIFRESVDGFSKALCRVLKSCEKWHFVYWADIPPVEVRNN